jgi:hypothetical protein
MFIKTHGMSMLIGLISLAFVSLGISILIEGGDIFKILIAFGMAVGIGTLSIKTYITEKKV